MTVLSLYANIYSSLLHVYQTVNVFFPLEKVKVLEILFPKSANLQIKLFLKVILFQILKDSYGYYSMKRV